MLDKFLLYDKKLSQYDRQLNNPQLIFQCMQIRNYGDHLLHCYTQLTRWLLGEVSYTHGAIHLASELLMFNTKIASSSIKVAFEKKNRQNIFIWDLVLKSSSRETQR